MRKLITSLLVASTCSFNLLAADISGDWDIQGHFDVDGSIRVDLVCTFTQNDGKLSGSCTGGDGSSRPPVTGQVDGKQISWQFDTGRQSNGQNYTITFMGRLDNAGTVIEGTLSAGGQDGPFTAKKH